MAKKNLVIVESPAKARTLGKIMGTHYTIKASMGHVRDLPQKSLGVALTEGVVPRYVVPQAKKAVVKEIKDAAAKAAAVYLATDPDREGEAISWHLVEAAKLEDIPTHRVVFHEITEEAIKDAFKHPRSINMNLVNAQQARRVLDRLVGYKISPLLWKKVRSGLSAGRVQSVALRMIVEREDDIRKFVAQEYWTIEAELSKTANEKKPSTFTAKLAAVKGEKSKLEITQGRRGTSAGRTAEEGGLLRIPGEEEEGHPPTIAALHHQHPAAGGLAEASLHRPAHHGCRSAAIRRPAHRRGRPGGSHHLHAN